MDIGMTRAIRSEHGPSNGVPGEFMGWLLS
jgi:hypothetical protein